MTTTWIFQGNPSTFDLDGYLHAMPGAITWLARQNAKEMNVGDTVFLWRSQGKGSTEARSGVIASAEIISPVSTMLGEPESQPFWIDTAGLGTAEPRVWLKLDRVAGKKEELKREWLKVDECLQGMLILRQAAGTNFKLTDREGERLRKMWSRVGQNWSRSESLAGLWAYLETYGKEVSKSTASPVGIVSKLTGRTITGVYNKVMNFRNIDPRDSRQGLSGAGSTDREVWDEFFDATEQVLATNAIRAEFDRVWRTAPLDVVEIATEDNSETEAFSGEVEKLVKRNLDELMAAYSKQRSTATAEAERKPRRRSAKTTVFQRNPLVVAIARLRAANRCEVPGCSYELFEDESGSHYCEVHHILPLSQGGPDTIDNAICLCPMHHREAHFGKRSGDLREQFREFRIEPTKTPFAVTKGTATAEFA